MLQKRDGTQQWTGLTDRARRVLWTLTGLDVAVAAWMVAAGDWLDRQSALTAVVTLGGHHEVVLWLAVLGFAFLAVLASVTAGFTVVGRTQLAALAVAGVISLVAVAAALSVAALVVVAALLAAFLGRVVLR